MEEEEDLKIIEEIIINIKEIMIIMAFLIIEGKILIMIIGENRINMH